LRDITHRRAEYDRLLRRLCELWSDLEQLDRSEITSINARLREMLREDGVKEGRGQGGHRL
jgi:hypothetical protein